MAVAVVLVAACGDNTPAVSASDGTGSMTTSMVTMGRASSGEQVLPGTTLAVELTTSASGTSGSTLGATSSTSGELRSSTTSGTTTGVGLVCGDGTAEAFEICDGDDLRGADCLAIGFDAGELGCGADCSAFDTSRCTSEPLCGDGQLEAPEACDALDLGRQTCLSLGFFAGDLGCGGDCTYDTSACLADPCGNGVLDELEVCDGEALAGQSCVGLDFDFGQLACVATCDAYDTSGCADVGCGNGVLEPGEVCDGLQLAGQTCASLGFAFGPLGCNPNCNTFEFSDCV